MSRNDSEENHLICTSTCEQATIYSSPVWKGQSFDSQYGQAGSQ